ncbi:discoidin domain-containing protein [Parabacteroides merdae]|nr:discoidin domain-containing protein [Parabacteroides merdae]
MGNYRLSWHSQWSGGSIPLPHEIVVDMKKETTLTNISLTERQHDSYRDVKGGEFFVSSDKLNWTAVGAFEAQKVLEEQIFSITPTKGRYFKIKITDSYRASNSSLAEIHAYGID